jgi:hypothetical protein
MEDDKWAKRPKYARELIWAKDEYFRTTTADSTEEEAPVPRPPQHELQNRVALNTIKKEPHLFKIVTPIRVDKFQNYLLQHPNPLLVRSVCWGLRNGFWPWANTENPPNTTPVDNSRRGRPLRPSHQDFVKMQRDSEVDRGRYSDAFGPKLLPGMISMPIGVVPKPPDGLRMIIDQSVQPSSQNALIPKEAVSIRVDNMSTFGAVLRRVRLEHPRERLVVFKSDVSQAYRLMPMHPLWQIRQIVTIDGKRHVDRCNQFGNRAGGKVWASFASLVLWIATHVKKIPDLLGYVDDNFSWEFESRMSYYEPYKKSMPAKQVRLLQLWDDLGIPHEERKQQWGTKLTIIGFEVDPNGMTITMPRDARQELIKMIDGFAMEGQERPLREFQLLFGWINWALNVFPLLRPGLSAMSSDMAGRRRPTDLIRVSATLKSELSWVAHWVLLSKGIQMMESIEWEARDADLTFYSDACETGMSFWSPKLKMGLQRRVSGKGQRDNNYLEAWSVVAALAFATKLERLPKRVAIFTDNSGAVSMFNTLRANPKFNPLLISAADMSMDKGVSFRVFLVSGTNNAVADALSRFRNEEVLRQDSKLKVRTVDLSRSNDDPWSLCLRRK